MASESQEPDESGALSRNEPTQNEQTHSATWKQKPTQEPARENHPAYVETGGPRGSEEDCLRSEEDRPNHRYPRRERRKAKKFGDEILCKMMEGNYSVSTLVKTQSDIILDSLEHLTFTLPEDERLPAQEQATQHSDTKTKNVNLSKRGSEPVALKVYHWFDDYENLDTDEALSPSQVKDLFGQGKVAKNHSCLPELEIIWEDLVNGPYFGDDRDLGERQGNTIPPPRGSFPCEKDESEVTGQATSSGDKLAIVGTTSCVRGGGFQSEALIKRIQPSYDRIGLDTQDHADAEFDTSIGKLIIMELPDVRHWSRNIIIDRTDFFETKRSMAVAISADLQMKTMLSAELDREYAHKEFLFRQRPQTGKLLVLPPSLTQEPDKHICYLVTRARERERVALPTLFKCL